MSPCRQRGGPRARLLGGLCLALAGLAALPAQAAPPAPGAEVYPAEFFAAARPNTAYDMVLRLPGFALTGGEAVRGYADAAGNVLVNGVRPTSKSETLEDILKRIPSRNVARIVLLRGAGSGADMQGKTLVANIELRNDTAASGAISVSGTAAYDGRKFGGARIEGRGPVAGGQAEAALVVGSGAGDEAGEGLRTRYADGAAEIPQRIDQDAEGRQGRFTAAYEGPAFGGTLRLNGYGHLGRDTFEERAGAPDRPADAFERDVVRKRNGELGVRFARALGAVQSVEAIGLLRRGRVRTTADFDAPGFESNFALERHTRESIARVVARDSAGGLSWEAGGELAFNVLRSRTAFRQNGALVPLPAANVRVEETRGEAFAIVRWQVQPTLTAELGLRYEASQIESAGDLSLRNSFRFAKPRFAATWTPQPQLQMRLRLEREVGQLSFDDFVAASQALSVGSVFAGNPDLTPQQALVAELGVERRFGAAGAIVVTARHAELRDVIDRIAVTRGGVVFDAPGNIGDGRRDDLEATLNAPLSGLGLPGGRIAAKSAWRRTRVTDPATGRPRSISGVKPWVWDVLIEQDLTGLATTWGVTLTGGRREVFHRASEVETVKVGASLGGYVEHKAPGGWTLRLEAFDLTSRDAKRVRRLYAGARTAGAPAAAEVQDLEFGPQVVLKIRKSLP